MEVFKEISLLKQVIRKGFQIYNPRFNRKLFARLNKLWSQIFDCILNTLLKNYLDRYENKVQNLFYQ